MSEEYLSEIYKIPSFCEGFLQIGVSPSFFSVHGTEQTIFFSSELSIRYYINEKINIFNYEIYQLIQFSIIMISISTRIAIMGFYPFMNKNLSRFSVMKLSRKEEVEYLQIVRSIKSVIFLSDLSQLYHQEKEKIQKYGKTALLDFLNEYHISPQINTVHSDLYYQIQKFQDLNQYQKITRLSIMSKLAWMSFDVFEKKKTEYVKQMLQDLREGKICLINSFNLFFMFQISREEELCYEILKNLNEKIISIKQNFEGHKMFHIFLNQLNNIKWDQLHQFQNIIEFICFKLSLGKGQIKFQNLIQYFEKITSLKLHHTCRVPKCLDEIVTIANKDLDKKPLEAIFRLLKCFQNLPTSYSSHFFLELKEIAIFRKDYVVDIKMERYLPYSRLSTNQIQSIFKNWSNNRQELFYSCVFNFEDYEKKKYFFNNVMVKYLEEGINRELPLSSITWATNLLQEKKSILAQKGKAIINKTLNLSNYRQLLKEFSFSNFVNLIQIVKDEELKEEIVRMFIEVKNIRSNNCFKFKKYQKSLINTIQLIFFRKYQFAYQVCNKIMWEVISGKNIQIKAQILFLLLGKQKIDQERNQMRQIIENTFIQRKQGLSLLVDYYIFHNSKSTLKTNRLIEIIIQRVKENQQQFPVLHKFIINVPARTSATFYEGLNSELVQLFGEIRINELSISLSQINKWNNLIVILMNFDLFDFNQPLYQRCLSVFYDQIVNSKSVLSKTQLNSIISFIDYFDIIFFEKQKKSEQILITIKKMEKILSELKKRDYTLYVSVKYLELINKYKQSQIYSSAKEHQIKDKVLKNVNSVTKNQYVFLTLLYMHCQGYKFLSLSSINNGYHQLLSAVSEKKFNICDFHIHILNYVHNQPTSQVIKDDMQLYILPLVREIYKSESHQKSYHLMKTFGQFFQLTKENNMLNVVLKEMLTINLRPLQIHFVLSLISKHNINQDILDLYMNRVLVCLPYFACQLSQILHFFEFLQYHNSPEEQKFLNQIYSRTEKNIQNELNSIQEQNLNYETSFRKMMTFYIACCIKSKRNNVTFRRASQFFLKQAENHTQSQEYQSMSLEFLKSYCKGEQVSKLSLKNEKSLLLQQYLAEQEIQFEYNTKVNGIVCQYYLPKKDQIVLVARQHHLSILDQNQLAGNIKFIGEVLKQCAKNNVSIFKENQMIFMDV